ncbi:hypothetical protein HAX54_007481 [Datura stramonium]|uniref:Uncharacterized protein n=1 Tax=Datura stramonium TaxID=4076 RepID=A0ABS8TC09_DATST|nr:hypothetical protein [Datura stramonium]
MKISLLRHPMRLILSNNPIPMHIDPFIANLLVNPVRDVLGNPNKWNIFLWGDINFLAPHYLIDDKQGIMFTRPLCLRMCSEPHKRHKTLASTHRKVGFQGFSENLPIPSLELLVNIRKVSLERVDIEMGLFVIARSP